MSNLQNLINELDQNHPPRKTKPLTELGSYILGAIFENSQELYETNTLVERISDYASDLETSNGSDDDLLYFWEQIKRLTQTLKDSQK